MPQQKMSNAPIYYALVQAQFNPVAAMAKYVNEVQDRLRRQGYTLFEPRQVTELKWISGPGQVLLEPRISPSDSWYISKESRSSGFILRAASIAFHTTHYETNEEFIQALLLGLEAVHAVVGLDHLSRLGIRYLDAVLPKKGETVDQYLADALHGVQLPGAEQGRALSESLFTTRTEPLSLRGTLVARVHRVHGPLGYPPDLVPYGLEQKKGFNSKKPCSHAILDTDHFVAERIPMTDFEQIRQQLSSLHKALDTMFHTMISGHALKVWK